MIIGIQDEILRIYSLGFLDKLLEDKTTKKNILWATNAYEIMGDDYYHNHEIISNLIVGRNSDVIKNRTRKEMEQQNARTRQSAEVFTPLWVCNKMNNYADEVWFGKPDIFNVNGSPTKRVEFPDGKTWKQYVDSRRMEITCGEAPYLVSRYDVSTGEVIQINERIGILDRKLRVVNENAPSEEEWVKWAIRAFEATYGYEFQGDNVLIARVNLLMTFEEYLEDQWHREPTEAEYRKIINVITWNIWQMDGLTGAVPYADVPEEYQQLSLFDYLYEPAEGKDKTESTACRIFDWRGNCSLEYNQLGEERSA